jgi:hypothetical protein
LSSSTTKFLCMENACWLSVKMYLLIGKYNFYLCLIREIFPNRWNCILCLKIALWVTIIVCLISWSMLIILIKYTMILMIYSDQTHTVKY